MDAKFTIPYGEYSVADELSREKLSVFIPSSRQEKGIDLILYKYEDGNNKTATVQVKQSKTYFGDKLIKVGEDKIAVSGYLWFNRFEVQENADWFLLTGLRVVHPKAWDKAGIKDVSWESITLAFTHDEMKFFMDNVKQRRNPSKDDSMFGFHYDRNKNIYQTRGCQENICVNDYLLENRISDIKSSMK